MQAAPPLMRTLLHDEHAALGAKLVPFAGWEMPLRYAGTIAEHHAVRTGCGVFDVSHMGLLAIAGPSAASDLQRILSNDVEKLEAGQAQYTLLTNDHGGIEDDLICYCHEPGSRYELVVNAANRSHDMQWIAGRVSAATSVDDISDAWGILAIQGPQAPAVLADIGLGIHDMAPFRHYSVEAFGGAVTVATTGYTGEAGAELIVEHTALRGLWERLVSDDRVEPCGLGARDTLRLEVCYPLHGADIDADTDPIGAGLGWTLGWGTGFTGEDALAVIRADGPARRLQAVRMDDSRIPRPGCPVLDAGGSPVGTVTSGTKSPMLGTGIALAWIDARFEPGHPVGIDIRGRIGSGRIARRPLYSDEDRAAALASSPGRDS